MKNEAEPITDDEWLLRRVHRDAFKNDRSPTHSPRAFAPRTKGKDPDDEGISLYREACLESVGQVLANVSEEKRGDNGIVRIQVKDIKELGLTVRADHDDRVPGHVVIPELNASAYANSKSSLTPTLEHLASICSEDESIARWPRPRG